MNLYMLSAVTLEQSQEALKNNFSVSKVYLDDEIKHISTVSQLFEDTSEKILAIDPDWCDWKLDSSMLERISKLQAIFVSSTSYDWIDIKYLKSNKTKLFNTPNFSSQAVAEWNMLMAINLARKIPLLIKEGCELDYKRYQGFELTGKTCGVVGLGNIGNAYAQLAKGIGMNVQYWSRSSRNSKYSLVELNTLFETSDVIFIALEVNEETKRLITDAQLKSMKSTSILTTAIDHIYNHELLLQLVEKEEICGYGFESKSQDFLSYKGNVWAAPALAWCTRESFERNIKTWFDTISNYMNGIERNRIV